MSEGSRTQPIWDGARHLIVEPRPRREIGRWVLTGMGVALAAFFTITRPELRTTEAPQPAPQPNLVSVVQPAAPSAPAPAPAVVAEAPAPVAMPPVPSAAPERAAPVMSTVASLEVPNSTFKGDLDGMIKRRSIRILVAPSRTQYFVDMGAQGGITFDYGRELEKRLNKKFKTGNRPIQVSFIPLPRDQLIPALLAGRGDIIAANLTITPERRKSVDFTVPMVTGVNEVVVTGPGSPTVSGLEDLAGQEVVARRTSSYWSSLEALNEQLNSKGLAPIRLTAVNDALEDEDLMEMLAAGQLPLLVVDDNKAKLWAKVLPGLIVRSDLMLREGGKIGWAFRPGSPKLEAELDAFAKDTAQGTTFGNVVLARYLASPERLKNNAGGADRQRFLDLQQHFDTYGQLYGIDPLLLAAQAFQESELDQSRRSAAGAVGVMQLLPDTAKAPPIGITRIDRVENNIHAGAKYLRYLIDSYFADPAMDAFNRTLLAFAAYNAGPAKMAAVRDKAAKLGLDPNRWFGQVEIAASREVGRETVTYVANILKYFTVYQRLMEQEQVKRRAAGILLAQR
ncbi:MAG: lytic transglycosylase F [Geminicoccaceae bacterium]